MPAVRALLATTQALEPVRTVQTFLARAAPRQVVEAGLATDAHPRVRRAVLQALCRSLVDGAVEVLRQLRTRPELTAVDRGLLLDRLEALGDDVSLLDPERTLSLEAWAELARAEGADAVPKDLRGLPLVTALAPLGELPVRWLFTQARELGEERLPRPFRHLLERHLPPQALPALGRHALESWLSVKPKANTAIRALGRMGTVFALSQLERIASAGGRYTESLVQNAREGLAEAAAARGLTPEQLREELVPDLGLTLEGLVVDLGPRRLRVKVRADLSLEVHHESGRVTQSFPALRKDEDPVKHAEGKQRFDVLRKNLTARGALLPPALPARSSSSPPSASTRTTPSTSPWPTRCAHGSTRRAFSWGTVITAPFLRRCLALEWLPPHGNVTPRTVLGQVLLGRAVPLLLPLLHGPTAPDMLMRATSEVGQPHMPRAPVRGAPRCRVLSPVPGGSGRWGCGKRYARASLLDVEKCI